jgi:hypothetical protein
MKQHISIRMLEAKNFLVNRVQNPQNYTEKRSFINAKHLRKHSLLGVFYRDIKVQVAEIQCLVVIHVPHRSLMSAVNCQNSDCMNAILHAMCAR